MSNKRRGTSDHKSLLEDIAHQAMLNRGLVPDFSPEVQQQVAGIAGPARDGDGDLRDLRDLLWCSIDNDDSRDLDQLTVAQVLADGTVKILGPVHK